MYGFSNTVSVIVLYIALALVHAAQYVVWFNGLLSVIVFDQKLILVHYNCLLLLLRDVGKCVV